MESDLVNNKDASIPREPLRLTENALVVLRNRYLKRNELGEASETPEQLFERVARTVAAVETSFGADEPAVRQWETRFYNLMASLRFLPNSPTLMNAGRSMGMLSACFVLPVPDSIDGIFDAVKHTALIQKAGGGTGFSFDQLRPTGDYIASSGGKTSGPISFWKVLSETTNAIQQGAFRRGANMGMMSLTHPDILKFLQAKQNLEAFTNYNISVKVTQTWMEQFQAAPDSPHVVQNPRTGRQYYLPADLDIKTYQIDDLVEAAVDDQGRPVPPAQPERFWSRRQLWQLIVQNAHRTGEPGLAFIDRINRDNMVAHLGAIEATNPCGEQPLLAYEACNLGSINLARFVRSAPTDEGALLAEAAELAPLRFVDFTELRQTIHESVRFLDNIIEINDYQIPQIDQRCRQTRKIGLGVMGFADALYQLAVAYDSETGCAVGRELMRLLNNEAHAASEDLARQRGCFPAWEGSCWQTQRQRPQRNAAVTTVAPTGTLSIIADCSGGIEPLFSVVFIRNVLGDKHLLEVNPVFRRIARARGFDREELYRRIAQAGSLGALDEIPADLRRIFVTAHDISPEWHVRMQAAFQDHCDAAISKTINFPHDATVEQVSDIYRLAYELGCKGITVYRDGCRHRQPMSRLGRTEAGDPPSQPTPPPVVKGQPAGKPKGLFDQKPLRPIDLPEIMPCVRVRQLTPFGNMHVKITVDPVCRRELEVFAQLGKGGDLANSDLEAICRLLSLLLRCGGSLNLAIKQLDGIGSSLTIPAREGRIMSLADGLAKAMTKYLKAKHKQGLQALLLGNLNLADKQKDGTIPPEEPGPADMAGPAGLPGRPDTRGRLDSRGQPVSPDRFDPPRPGNVFKIKCPSCGGILSFAEGCVKCHDCGFSQC